MGFSFRPPGCGQPAKECRTEKRADNANGPRQRAAKAKENPADVKPAAY
jgi:hypothetical protein